MKKQTVSMMSLAGFYLLLFILFARIATASPNDQFPEATDIYTSRTMANGRPSGVINTSHLSVFGPNICTSFGDPFSPLNSIWEPGPYTYHFRILVPADYPSDILRVELFDPDSINQSNNTASVYFTDYAHSADPISFPLAGQNMNCPNLNQKEQCLIPTGELVLLDPTGHPPIAIDQINPFWFMRVDENRGHGLPPGDGTCGSPPVYDPAFNTSTVYELYYYAQNPDNSIIRVDLARYTGQTGDGIRDNGDHQTDMHWVSPGGSLLYDQPASVPTDIGSPKDFELSLSQDLPNVVKPDSGSFFVYLDITTISGASENGFDIWAGPLNPAISSNVNVRNIQVLNNPAEHSSQGVVVTALNYLPKNSTSSFATDIPLTHVEGGQAGQSAYVSLFDTDAGAQPPIIFYFDTLAESDWSLTFGAGDPDPDGVSGRCQPGSCYDEWVNPPYEIQIPTLTGDCDLANPDPQICTPFYGGRLMARYIGGEQDTHVWQVSAPKAQYDPTVGCTAFPIIINEYGRSVTKPLSDLLPGEESPNPYPEANHFTYPSSPPSYAQFFNHVPNVPMSDAQEGYIFKVKQGAFETGSFGWLVWNTLYVAANATTLTNSMTWPGDSSDYPIRGYYEPGDPADMEMHTGDWVAASAGSIASLALMDVLNDHIDLGRVLRLPAWSITNGLTGAELQYQMNGFALFRLHGYNASAGNDGPWLLLEFMGWDHSCSQPTPPTQEDIVINLPELISTPPITAYEPVDFQVTITNTGEIDVNTQFSVDLFLDPADVYTDSIPIELSSGTTTVNSLPASTSRVVTITAPLGFTNNPETHLVYAMADSQEQIWEGDETNNVSLPLSINNVTPISPTIQSQPNCGNGSNVQFQVSGADWPSNEAIDLYWDNALDNSIAAGHFGSFTQTWVKSGLSDGVYEIRATSASFTATADFTVPCPISPQTPNSIVISGLMQGLIEVSHTFTATVSPITTTLPLTYTWEATGQEPFIQPGSGLTNSISFSWPITGTKTITVSVTNAHGGPVTDIQTIEIIKPVWFYYLPVMIKP